MVAEAGRKDLGQIGMDFHHGSGIKLTTTTTTPKEMLKSDADMDASFCDWILIFSVYYPPASHERIPCHFLLFFLFVQTFHYRLGHIFFFFFFSFFLYIA
ncbi:uncharacterized protein DS421_5g166220 [Arachis hypogaea]|nr:uncharacterized protein DS421_5g166220 [Arachis hypogaea]